MDTLRLAESRVKAVISDRFEEAVAAGDLASVERFFKLFPLVNMHQEGLEKFTTKHLCIKLVKGSANLVLTVKLHKRGPLLQKAGHPFPCYLASPVLPSCLLPRQVAHRLSK